MDFKRVKSEIKLITPEEARRILKFNDENRNISASAVDKYARDIINGDWKFNGEGIQISKTRKLKNGQHRLMAIIKADKPVFMNVVTGIEDDVFTYDVGKKRSIIDENTLSGKNQLYRSSNIIGAARMCLCYIKGVKTNSFTNNETNNFINDHEKTFECIYKLFCGGTHETFQYVRKASILSAIFFALETGYDLETARRFVKILNTGFYDEDYEVSSVVLRNQMISKEFYPLNSENKRKLFDACGCALNDFEKGKIRKTRYKDRGNVYFGRYMLINSEKIDDHE